MHRSNIHGGTIAFRLDENQPGGNNPVARYIVPARARFKRPWSARDPGFTANSGHGTPRIHTAYHHLAHGNESYL
jgi:hypothetical protein